MDTKKYNIQGAAKKYPPKDFWHLLRSY